MTCAAMTRLTVLSLSFLLLCISGSGSLFLPDSKELRQLLSRYEEEADRNGTSNTAGNRTRRAIRWSDREEIIQLHNKLRGVVYPTASNMEYMVWDDELERSATHWAGECQWDHGPQDLLMSIGQNLAVHWGRYRSPAFHVQAWYDEVKDYTYPYPHECNPWCPERCSGPMCTHYTQLVWATTNRVGCAVHVCPKMDVWGEIWENAVYLVCNYSPKGNWIGEAPYQHGRPCSQCPPSYGGGCRNNLCYKDSQRSETEDMNEVEKPQVPMLPRTTAKPAPKPKPSTPKKPVFKPSTPKLTTPRTPSLKTTSNNYLAQNIKCETRLRDKCKGATCNRYICPANCMTKKGKVWGTLYYDVQSSICRAAIHFGVIDNNGGLVDITRMDKLPFFVKATKNGIESLSKYKPGNAFVVAKVEEMTADCYTTVAEICPFKKPYSHCPRIFCPANCKTQPSYWSPVIGNNIYTDNSSICKTAIHAGVIKADGGLVDVLPLDKRKSYLGVLKNGIQSESKTNTEGGSFRVFAVRE
ncbi:cysteine-rich secretory protein LCCL domain-containing 2 [Seriola lalandi dorsalis]|uniref:Cysteine rich secretory protein LCCL domain containing 2 n=1 Tax=Seriola lalandi dorsalis TaxID=1841481 RepID=A0A3B4XFV8_SERLL|nr:cysteine-rich secretory protein LCCL domain-containing 2 [Seriola lalandi dorsalis]XP_056236791.1 cysteine-rich secretory protein LCCL domain-containing 2 [Seriola aureovittata]